MKKFVRDVLEDKGYEVFSIEPDRTVYEALESLADRNVGALLVLDGDEMAGIFSERDYARKIVLKGKTSMETRVREIMSPVQHTVQPGDSVRSCMELMTEKRVRHLPVLEEDELIGIISIGDVVKTVISEQEQHINHLQNYITGSY